jgi:hypothetical protein
MTLVANGKFNLGLLKCSLVAASAQDRPSSLARLQQTSTDYAGPGIRRVVVDRDPRIVEESRERSAAVARIADRLTERTLRRMVRLLGLEPCEEGVHRFATTRLPQLQVSCGSHDAAQLGVVLDAIDLEDQIECAAGWLGLARQRLEEFSPNV